MSTPVTAIAKKRAVKSAGLEDALDLAAVVILSVGILWGVITFVMALGQGALWGGLVSMLGIGFTAWLGWLVFRFLAESLRLLKKISGLDYRGEISGQIEYRTETSCGNCGVLLHSASRCDGCGAQIIDRNQQSPSE